MLRITPSKSANGAIKYFEEGLSKADYYAAGEQSIGKWNGLTAQRLGLEGKVQKKEFAALCHNRTPEGEKLNPRDSQTRKVGYDFTFSAPKSASMVYTLNRDERIRKSFESAVTETMQELEQDMRTQMGQGTEKKHVRTGNMVWGEFTHLTARPVDGIADPHLHSHCFVMNTTWNEQNKTGRFQAGEFGSIVKDAPYYEAAFDARFAHKVKQLGYRIEKRGHSWEIAGIENSLLQKFSRRTVEIESAAKEESKKNGFLTAKQKDKLGQRTRASKKAGQAYEALRYEWLGRLSKEETASLYRARPKMLEFDREKKSEVGFAAKAINSALRHCLERKSAIRQKHLLTEALKKSYGEVLPETMNQQIKQARHEGRIYQNTINGKNYITTSEAIKMEKKMIRYVRQGRGKSVPINPSFRPQSEFLNDQQKAAIRHVLQSSDQVMIIAGGAGTGKTTLMKEVKQGIEAEGKQLFGFAPSAAASRGVMRKEGFSTADTLQQFLINEKMQAQTKGQVIWIDEAGMISNKAMNEVFEIAQKHKSRILLTGDSKQHSSVEAGDALRIIEEHGGVKVARVNQIQRQRKNPHYKQVVSMISEDKIEPAIAKLERMGGVIEMQDKRQRLNAVVKDYTQTIDDKKTALIVSPTHHEGRQVTQAIRQHLQEKGVLQKEEKTVFQLKKVNLTEEQKKDSHHYEADQMIQFHQNAPGFKKGERWQVQSSDKDQLKLVNSAGQTATLPLTLSKRFTLFQKNSLQLSKGDKIRITQGGKTTHGSRIHNGDIVTLQGFSDQGALQLTNGKVIAKDFGHLSHGYVATSHSSQGKTVDRVFIVQSNLSKAAASKQQFYVSISRGREMAKIYTDDKMALQQSVRRDGKRITASQIAEREKRKQNTRKYWDKTESSTSHQKNQQHGKQSKEIA